MTEQDKSILALLQYLSPKGMEALRNQLGVQSKKRISKKQKLQNCELNRKY